MALDPAIAAQRFGYGLRPSQPVALGSALRGADPALALHPGPTSAEALELRNAMQARLVAGREGSRGELQAARKRNQSDLVTLNRDSLKRALARAVDSPDSYRERLAQFWADHFTIQIRDAKDQPRLQPYGDEAIRPHLTGSFAQLLKAAILHPLMLVYLDQSRSVGPSSAFGQRRGLGLNENLARELLELHTLGVAAGYEQTDVRELAKVLTGLSVSRDGVMEFRPDRAEPGAETVLGRAYGGLKPRMADIEALLADLAVHPATARHLAQKLAVHFVADQPPAALVTDLAAVWSDTAGDLASVHQALLDHPLAHDPRLGKARQPFDFIVSALRALGVSGDAVRAWDHRTLKFAAIDPLRQMAQPWQAPLGPDGWEEDLDRWITPQALARRITWAMRLPARLSPDLPDARAFLAATLPFATESLGPIIARAETNRDGIGLILASPEFNRR